MPPNSTAGRCFAHGDVAESHPTSDPVHLEDRNSIRRRQDCPWHFNLSCSMCGWCRRKDAFLHQLSARTGRLSVRRFTLSMKSSFLRQLYGGVDSYDVRIPGVAMGGEGRPAGNCGTSRWTLSASFCRPVSTILRRPTVISPSCCSSPRTTVTVSRVLPTTLARS